MMSVLCELPIPRLRRTLSRVCLMAAFVAVSVTHAHAVGPDPGLRLPRCDGVRPGDVVTFRWDPSDRSITELEILLSVDGGRHYTEWVSPRLDPRSGVYRWRVPDLGVARMYFRIRFNRGGHEIEGASAEMICALDRQPDPCDLPAPATAEADAAGGSGDGGTGDGSSQAPSGPALGRDERDPARGSSRSAGARCDCTRGFITSGSTWSVRTPGSDSAPLFIPPRK